ncbi:MAG: hypothetical protein K2P38_16515, partial [Lachnospiraceae bacterium]|nr:hypothetical protein [Lachnospiraceae bacterium]
MREALKRRFMLPGKAVRRLVAVLAAGSMLILAGCHGKEGLKAFVIPEGFDESEEYEITFWAKTIPTRPRRPFTRRRVRI